jgi:hypothetical protein
MEDDPTDGDGGQRPESLLPYDDWTEQALRQVMVRAIQHVAAHGLPGEHHFYITFRTDHPGVSMPARLRAQYKQEMTIVLQHQFWDLALDEAAGVMSVGLSFGGVGSTLRIPIEAISAFADPYVRMGMRFRTAEGEARVADDAAPEDGQKLSQEAAEPPAEPAASEGDTADAPAPQVVSLDAFRRRTPPKES